MGEKIIDFQMIRTDNQPTFTCSKSTMEKRQNNVSNLLKVNDKDNRGVFFVNFEQILYIVLVFLLLTLYK